MEHNLFKPKGFNEAQHAVVGDCNGFTMQQRWEAETPDFAKSIIQNLQGDKILDYGCGVGRIAKEILNKIDRDKEIKLLGVDRSSEMLLEAKKYVNNINFDTSLPEFIDKVVTSKFDLAYCVYVLQHVPSIEIREILSRIHYNLKDDGIFVYCSSDYRMCIRYDGKGFFDDRFLGVNLQEEISRYFDYVGELFTDEELNSNTILNTMIKGGLQHPAKVYKKRKISTQYFDVGGAIEKKLGNIEKEIYQQSANNTFTVPPIIVNKTKKKLLLINRLAPGDILVMTNAIRDIHQSYPGVYKTDIRTPCNEIFNYNPYIEKINEAATYEIEINKVIKEFSSRNPTKENSKVRVGDIDVIDMHYPMIHTSGACGWHFGYGHRDWLEQLLGIKIQQTSLRPDIYLSQDEVNWVSPVAIKSAYLGKYWVINAGSKDDYTLKQYPYYQEFMNLISKDNRFKDIKFIQIGALGHNHTSLQSPNVIDMVGKTNLRELFRLMYHAEGLVTCVSLPMHIAASFEKPCVVVAGAREGTRWELYPNQQFLYVNGCVKGINCNDITANGDGCWKSKLSDCHNKDKNDIPQCMNLIRPSDIMRSIERYYEGGCLTF